MIVHARAMMVLLTAMAAATHVWVSSAIEGTSNFYPSASESEATIHLSQEAFAIIADPDAGKIKIDYTDHSMSYIVEHSSLSFHNSYNVHRKLESRAISYNKIVPKSAKAPTPTVSKNESSPPPPPPAPRPPPPAPRAPPPAVVYPTNSTPPVAPPPAVVYPTNSTPPVAPPPAVVNGTPAPSPTRSTIKNTKNLKRFVLAGSIIGAFALVFGLGFIWYIISRRRRHKDNKLDADLNALFFNGKFQNGIGPRNFSFLELAKVTSNFKDELKLGEGGFGAVYRGYIRDLDIYIAVKRVSKASKQGIKEYASEVKIISRLRHKNLVKLIGWCHDKGELILVYEFMANGSLDFHLFKGKSLLTWEVRFKIVHNLASALLYLHEEGDHCIIHRDIKASNIMLDSDFNAKLGDFGLARLVDHAKGAQTTMLAGTMGYIAPECVSSGKASKESDVYSFGVVALEIACGRRSIEPKYEESQASLIAWVWDLYGKKRIVEAADKKLCMEFDSKEMECLLMVGLWCVHPDPNLRPSIRQIIQVLNFEATLPILPSTRPNPTYELATANSRVGTSQPRYSSLTITVPR